MEICSKCKKLLTKNEIKHNYIGVYSIRYLCNKCEIEFSNILFEWCPIDD